MMKKQICTMIAVLLTFFVLTACSSNENISKEYPYYEMEKCNIENMEGMRIIPESLSELENKAAYVVQGKLVNDGEELSTGGRYPLTVTRSSLEITDVYKGELKRGDTIKLCEFYYIKDEETSPTLYHYSSYMPCEVDREYIFFLNSYPSAANWENTYVAYSFEMGRYPVISSNARSANDLDALSYEELYLQEDNETYRGVFREVVNKYMK